MGYIHGFPEGRKGNTHEYVLYSIHYEFMTAKVIIAEELRSLFKLTFSVYKKEINSQRHISVKFIYLITDYL